MDAHRGELSNVMIMRRLELVYNLEGLATAFTIPGGIQRSRFWGKHD